MGNIREVARLAGVSPATVSRVMNGTAKVDPQKKQRVLDAIRDTGFVPNEVARSLFRKSSRQIGLLIPSLLNPFFTQLAGAVDELAKARDYRVILCQVAQDQDQILHTMQMLLSMNVDGIVLAVSTPELQDSLEGFPVPVVAVDCMETARNLRATIYCDYYSGGRMAMAHLLDCGCRKVVCIRGDQEIFSARMRYQGYLDLCRERGAEAFTLDCDYDFQSGLEMTRILLEQYPDADGILACNDMVAISTFKILHKNHIRVPEENRASW